MLSRLPIKVLWNISHHLHKPQQCLTINYTRNIASSPTLNSKELEESKDTSNNRQVSTSFAEKAKSNAKTGGYGLVIIAGLGVIGTVVATILKVLPAYFTTNNILLNHRNYSPPTVPTVCMTRQCRTAYRTTGCRTSWGSLSRPLERSQGGGGGTG